jgi:hypothetical protein
MAAAITLATLANEMLPDLPGCEQPVALFYLRRAARRFAIDSEALISAPYATLVDATAGYVLTPPTSSLCEILRVHKALIAFEDTTDTYESSRGTEVDPEHYWISHTETSAGAPPVTTYNVVFNFKQDYVPDAAVAGRRLIVWLAMAPVIGLAFPASTLEQRFLSKWCEGIRFGATAALSNLAGRPWANPDAAQQYEDNYLREVARARFEVSLQENGEYKKVNRRMQFPSFL